MPLPPPPPPLMLPLPPPVLLHELPLRRPVGEGCSDTTVPVWEPWQDPPPDPWPVTGAEACVSSTRYPSSTATSVGYSGASATSVGYSGTSAPYPAASATSVGYSGASATSMGYSATSVTSMRPPAAAAPASDRPNATMASRLGHPAGPPSGRLDHGSRAGTPAVWLREPQEAAAAASGPENGAPSTSSHGSEEQDELVVLDDDGEGIPAELEVLNCSGLGEVVLIPEDVEPPPPAERPAYEFREFVSDDPAENADNGAAEWEVMRRLCTDSDRYKFVRQRWRNTEIPDPHRCLTYHGYRRLLVRANLLRMGLAGGRSRDPSQAHRGRGLKRTLSSTSIDSRPAGKRQRLAAGCAFVADWLLEQGRTLRTAGRVVPSLQVARRRMEQEALRFCRQLAFNMQLTPSQRQWEMDMLHERQRRELQLEFGPRTRRAAHRLNAAKAETETFFRFYTGLNNTDAENASWLTEPQRREVQEFEEFLVGQDRVYGECLDEDF
ncbi:uncharacterized protein LOC122385953 [Amphibalanus amphitrite]|uniref:uncharacterized protein LOC122385953 n=1 Tax=Amphibalanus amphitrite TaxID=1232801 RepID=UPI001C9159E9|nr:uncharacterized protein LOC122385953 [Amphibalanus amphitrite]